MAKTSAPPRPAWKSRWPKDGDLAAWMRAMLQKCAAIPTIEEAASESHMPISELERLGHAAEALRHVDRLLRLLPKASVLKIVGMAELGAEICLRAGDLARVERYLAKAAATEPHNTRKCDRGFSVNAVRDFKTLHGLLDPADAVGPKQMAEATFNRAARRFRAAMAAGDALAARSLAAEMEGAALANSDKWSRFRQLKELVGCWAELGDATAAQRSVRALPKDERDGVLDRDNLWRLGLKKQAIARARRDVLKELASLQESHDPNIHFPVMAAARALAFLVEKDERETARKLLRRVLKELPTWPVIERGWMTTGILKELGATVALIDGPEAAAKFARGAAAEARQERRAGFGPAARTAAVQAAAEVDSLESAIAQAKKLRSPRERRLALSRLLATGKRWRELREILTGADTPQEAASLIWHLKFALPGGQPP